MNARALGWVAAAAGLVTSAGCRDDPGCDDCCVTCKKFAACDLYSTVLGENRDECEARCALSDEDLRKSTTECVELAPEDPGSDVLALWCGDPDDAPCEAAAACIRGLYGQSPFAAVPDLFVDFVASTGPRECAVDPGSSSDGSTGPCPANVTPCEPTLATKMESQSFAEVVPPWCEQLGVAAVTVWVETPTGATPPLAAECLTTPGTVGFGRLEPGLVQPVGRLQGVFPAPAENATDSAAPAGPYCWVFRGATSVRGPSDSEHLEILLPESPTALFDRARLDADAVRKRVAGRVSPRSLYQCETGALRCTNGVDDDGDSLADCLDPDCAMHCREAESAGCRNGMDEDADGLVDCADPDCRAECPEAGLAACRDGVDNDQDRDVDCADEDCAAWCGTAPTPAAECAGEACDPGVSDLVQPERCDEPCPDPDDEACIVGLITFCGVEPAARCDDLIDNDGDGLTDVLDPDCEG